MQKLALALSGGASKGAFTAGAVRYLLKDKRLEFKIAVGTSTGSLVGGPALLGEYNYLRDFYESVLDRDIFVNSTIGTILNAFQVVSGPINATMGPLKELIQDYYITRGKLDELIRAEKTLVVSCVNARTGNVVFVSCDWVRDGKITPESFVRAILASCSEPFFTKPIQVFGGVTDPPVPDATCDDLFYDGGIKEFIPIEHCAALGADIVWAISTHPLENEHSKIDADHPPSVVDALLWTVTSLCDEVARGDKFRARLYNRWYQTKSKIIARAIAAGLNDEQAAELVVFPPRDELLYGLALDELHMISPAGHMHTSLEFRPDLMWGYYNSGYVTARRLCEDGTTQYTDDSLAPWYA
jgi:predicted acylesterase/phospholipase RssA